jgi:hypothetical protein
MSQYLLLVYEEELEPAGQAEREKELPMMLELHRSLREAGLLVGLQRLRSVESATSAALSRPTRSRRRSRARFATSARSCWPR